MRANRLLTLFAMPVLLGAVVLAQAPMQSPAGQSPTKGVVVKGNAPVSNDILKVTLPRPKEADLPNGIHLMVLEDHRVPQITMQMQITGAGPYYDPPDMPASLAMFTASMMMEGTTTRDARRIAQEQETLSSSVSVSATGASDVATMYVSSLTANFDRTLDLAADILLNPSFPEEDLARLKARQKAALLQVRSMPSFLAQERYARVVYGDHPASRLVPSAEVLDRIARPALVAFHKEHYVPDQAIIAIAGDTTLAEARAKIEARFGTWKKAGVTFPQVKDPQPIGPAKVYLVDRPNSVQTSLVVGTQAINRVSPDYDVLQVLNAVIGGGPTGRLFLNLREDKGWTYGAYSGVSAGRFRGDWAASTEIRGDVTELALHEILTEIGRTRTEAVSEADLLNKKRSAVASFAMSLESPTSILSNYITLWRYRLPADYWDKYPERVMAVTSEQVKAAAAKYLDPSRLQIVAVGDATKIGERLKKFGTVEVYDTEGKVKTGPSQ